MDTPSFAALFRADLRPQRFDYRLESDAERLLEGWIEVLPMDFAARTAFLTEVGFTDTEHGKSITDTRARLVFLIAESLVGGIFWHRPKTPGGLGDWQQLPMPDDPKQRRRWVEEHLAFAGPFGDWLVHRVLVVNGLEVERQGESGAS